MAPAGFEVRALLLPQHENGATPKSSDAADDSSIVAKRPVARERQEPLDQLLHEVCEPRAARMARHLHTLPGRQLRIGLDQKLFGLGAQLGDFLGDVEVVVSGQLVQFVDLGFELQDRAFELQGHQHQEPLLPDSG